MTDDPKWIDDFTSRLDEKAKAEFLQMWSRIKNRHNDNDELLALANFHGWLAMYMNTIPDRLNLTPDLRKEITRLFEQLQKAIEKLPPEKTLQNVEQLTSEVRGIHLALQNIRWHYEVRLVLALTLPSFLLGLLVAFICMALMSKGA